MRKALLWTVLAIPAAVGCAHKQPATPVAQTKENPVIVRLVSQHQTVTVHATGHGPVYSVADSNGRTIVADSTLEQLRAQHPEIYRQIEPAIAEQGDASVSSKTRGVSASSDRVIIMHDAAR